MKSLNFEHFKKMLILKFCSITLSIFFNENHKVDGQWGLWTSWSTCNSTCGGGSQTRKRLCNNPPPDGGIDCIGDAKETQSCNQYGCK